jgi:hypothetical protein
LPIADFSVKVVRHIVQKIVCGKMAGLGARIIRFVRKTLRQKTTGAAWKAAPVPVCLLDSLFLF